MQFQALWRRLRWRNVAHHVLLLLCIALISLSAIVVANMAAGHRLRQLDRQLANETVKLELNNLLQQRLLRLRGELQSVSLSSSLREYALYDRNARRLLGEILGVLHVLEHGGVFEDRYLVNFGNEEEIGRQVEYIHSNKGRLELGIIELKSHLEELQSLSREFSTLIFQREQLADQGVEEQNPVLDKKILFFFKGIQPFFGRILENANRMYHVSHLHLRQISEMRQQVERRGDLWVVGISAGALLLLLSVGILLLQDIRRILQERDQAQQLVQGARDNLEREVEQRTRELLQSNEQLRREVADRKQAQDTVRSQAEFLHSTIEALDHPFLVIDAESYRIILQNSAAAQLGNIVQGSCCYQLTHRRALPCDGQAHPCPLQEVRRTGRPCIVEHTHYGPQGQAQYVEVHGYPIFDHAGRVVQMIEYSLDISEKKAAEQALHRYSEELEQRVVARTRDLAEEVKVRQAAEENMEKIASHFRHLIEHAPGVVLIVETSGAIRYVSPSVTRVAGYAPEEMEGRSLFGFTHVEDDTQLAPMLKLAEMSHKTLSREFRFCHRDDHWIEVDSVISNQLDEPSVQGIVVNLWDITGRKQAENRLRRLSQVVEQSSNAVIITDTAGVIQYVNPAFIHTTGYTLPEVLGKNPSLLGSGRTPPEVFREMWATITSGREWSGEFINCKKNGEIYQESVRIAPMRDGQGHITHYIATKENITELKKARKQAEEASRIKSAFLANMSHEIRTPLNGIIGFIELLARRELDLTQRHYVDVIRKSADQLLLVINEILDLAKVESGRMELDLAPVDLAAAIEPAVEMYYARAVEKHLEFLPYIDPELPSCLISDAQRVNQVLTNLINNAIKFTPASGRVSVEILCRDNDGRHCRVACRVSDSGIGIAPDKQEEIFQPFAQADNSTTRRYGGTGLGLTISRRLVELLGGELLLESTPGVGASFSFTFPAEICPDQDVGDRPCLSDAPELFLLVAADEPGAVEQLLLRYLRAMRCGVREVPAASLAQVPDSGVVLALWGGLPPHATQELGRRCPQRLVLLIEPGGGDEGLRSCPGALLLTLPLNASKILDAVVAGGGRPGAFLHETAPRLQPFVGRRLLVAEDNPINQELVAIILEDLGIQCDIAGSGTEALHMFRHGGYDLVLMDVNMPDMDGIEATIRILELEHSEGRAHTPIIACTAHAFQDERQRILAAGMDNFLTKPLDPRRLLHVLELYLKKSAAAVDGGGQVVAPASVPPPVVYDIATMSGEIGIRPAMLVRMLESFLAQLTSGMPQLTKALEDGDRQALLAQVHSLAGAAANLRLQHFSAQLAEAERQLRQGQDVEPVTLKTHLTAAADEVARLVNHAHGNAGTGTKGENE